MAKDFLVEIGTEELPPKALKNLMKAFSQGVQKGLREQDLAFAEARAFAAPRRLAVLVRNLEEQTPLTDLEIWGPPAAIAFDAEGQPTKAAEAFAKKNGIAVSELQSDNDGKQDKLVYRAKAGGEAAQDKLEAIVTEALAALPIPKRMRWGAKRTEFVRPVQWVVMLFGSEIVDATILGKQAGRNTRGHRFHYNQEIHLNDAAEYVDKLRNPGYVLVDFAERQTVIREQVQAEGAKVNGHAVIDPDLLDEVTALVEFPVALTGRFEERFLEVPAEALISSMKEHQKYFHVVDDNGKLLPHFITVANIVSKDSSKVIDGNERVIRPRLADAAFFFETDKKTSLEDRREKLKTIVFQEKLGTVYDKTERIAALAKTIAAQIGGDEAKASRAGLLCKSDLVTDMVFEFADMQGIAGYHYALNDGEEQEVALTMQQHYQPSFAGDELPASLTACSVALADRLDTLTGIFGIGQKPTGSKDPFALRRATIGVLRILVEKGLALDLREVINTAVEQHSQLTEQKAALVDTILAYMIERFRAWYEDENIAPEIFMAVAAKNLSEPLDINKRVQAVNAFSQLEQAQALAAANKRVSNILAKAASAVSDTVDASLLKEDAEKALATSLQAISAKVEPLFAARDYTAALTELASLREVVDSFFDQVMVMADDEALKNNRLALLSQLRNLFLEVADISLLVPAK